MDFLEEHNILKRELEVELEKIFYNTDAPEELINAMKYSLLSNSKRLRPIIMLHLSKVFSVSKEIIIPLCCAIELIHTYSLIHDDLPALDNDVIRRGKASNHRVYGEDMGILAGDGLLNFAYEIMLANCPDENVSSYIKAISYIAECAGITGMIAGQVMDIKKTTSTAEELQKMHSLKTGKLFEASVQIPAILANVSKEVLINYKMFSSSLGLLFQVTDDILDIEGNSIKLGKTIGKDIKSSKATYISFYGLEQAKLLAKDIKNKCISYLRKTGYDEAYLYSLINYIQQREK